MAATRPHRPTAPPPSGERAAMAGTWTLHIQAGDDAPTRVLELGSTPVRVGRGIQCEVRLNQVGLGDVQCMIRRRGDEWYVQPVGPPGRIWVDDRPADNQRELPVGVELRVGRASLKIHASDPEQAGPGSFDAPITIDVGPGVAPPGEPILLVPPAPEPEPTLKPEPEPEPSPPAAVDTPDANSADDRGRRWQTRLEQRDQWLKDRQSEKRWEARWKAAGETLRARTNPPVPPAASPVPPVAEPDPPAAARPPLAPPPVVRRVEPRPVFGPPRRNFEPDRKPETPRVPLRPQPADPRPEPVAPTPELAAFVPEPAAYVPEPAAFVPEPRPIDPPVEAPAAAAPAPIAPPEAVVAPSPEPVIVTPEPVAIGPEPIEPPPLKLATRPPLGIANLIRTPGPAGGASPAPPDRPQIKPRVAPQPGRAADPPPAPADPAPPVEFADVEAALAELIQPKRPAPEPVEPARPIEFVVESVDIEFSGAGPTPIEPPGPAQFGALGPAAILVSVPELLAPPEPEPEPPVLPEAVASPLVEVAVEPIVLPAEPIVLAAEPIVQAVEPVLAPSEPPAAPPESVAAPRPKRPRSAPRIKPLGERGPIDRGSGGMTGAPPFDAAEVTTPALTFGTGPRIRGDEEPPAFGGGPTATARPVPTEAKEYPSARAIFAAQGARAAEAGPTPRAMADATRPRRVPEPTAAVRPDGWTIPFALGWLPTMALVLALGGFAVGLAVVWLEDGSSGSIAVRLATRAEGARSAVVDPATIPKSAWWQTTASHLAAWALTLERVGNGEDRSADARVLEADARSVSPLGARARFVSEPVPGQEADVAASIRLGPTRDVVTLTAMAHRLRRQDKRRDAIRAYRAAFRLAATTPRSTLSRPTFRPDPQINRYALPHSSLLDPIARDMVAAGDWTAEEWAEATPEFGPAELAVAAALREKDPAGAERRLEATCQAGSRPLDPLFEESEHQAAVAEAMAERGRWTDALAEYRRAIDGETRDLDRRVWWFNLAEVARKAGDDALRTQAIEAAKGTDLADEVTQRAANAYKINPEPSLRPRNR